MDAQEEAEITILEVSYLGGFVKYDLHTKDGNVDVAFLCECSDFLLPLPHRE